MKLMTSVFMVAASFAAGAAFAAEPATGEAVFNRWCVHCHSTGRGNPGTESLQVKYQGKLPAALLERTDLSAQVVTTILRTGMLSMPPFRKTEVTDAEAAAVAAYIARNYKAP